jgi:hypothetical protein
MKKQIKIVALAAVALLSVSAMAGATDINLYGSSAQYPYWATQAQDFMTRQLTCTGYTNTYGTTSTGVTPSGLPSGVSCYATEGTGCSTSLTSGTVNFRYCSNSSVTGILAVAGQGLPLNNPAISGDPDGCNGGANTNLRKMVNPDATESVSCQPVSAGVSDVAGEAFTQASSGNKLGPLGGGAFSASYTGINTSALGLTATNTVVTPFAFFVNNAVTATHCTAGLVGNLCTSNAQCNSQATATDGVCNTTATTINNLSRLEAVLLFSSQVSDWSFLGGYYTAQPVVLCLRHAGSGTHATLNYAVMNPTWGASLPSTQSAGPPIVWFNNATGDEENCINGDTSATGSGTGAGSAIGAVGYADAFVPFGPTLGVSGKSQNIAQVKYQGFWPTRTHIRNGQYDFYAVSYLYTLGTPSTLLNNLITYAKNPAYIPTSLANYWPAQSEMWFMKANDFSYPVPANATNGQTP